MRHPSFRVLALSVALGAAGAAEAKSTTTDNLTVFSDTKALSPEQVLRDNAERYGAASPKPLPVTSRGDAKATELVTKFKAITDPKEQTAFWRSLTPEQRTLILNAQ